MPSVVAVGSLNATTMFLPCSSAVISVARIGRFRAGGRISPITPQPDSGRNRKAMPAALKNVPAEILVLDNFRELASNIGGVYFYVLLLQIRAFEGNLFEQFLH